jgi:hypothetical protein
MAFQNNSGIVYKIPFLATIYFNRFNLGITHREDLMARKLWYCLIFVGSVMIFTGCGAQGYRESYRTQIADDGMVDVKINVLLERGFVQANSNLGAGAIAMYFFAGPFSNNVMVLYGSVRQLDDKNRTVGTFSNGLKWGENSFNTRIPKNSEIQFRLRSGGTRTGMTDLGYAKIGERDKQAINISLTEAGVSIE